MPEQYIINGVILALEDVHSAQLKVQAIDRDLPSLERRVGFSPYIMGEALTDAEGRFQIAYNLEQFRSGEGTPLFRRAKDVNANISFRIFDDSRRELKINHTEALNRCFSPDQIIFNAPARLEVQIFLEPAQKPGDSEAEQLIARISPVIGDERLASLGIAALSRTLHEAIEEVIIRVSIRDRFDEIVRTLMRPMRCTA